MCTERARSAGMYWRRYVSTRRRNFCLLLGVVVVCTLTMRVPVTVHQQDHVSGSPSRLAHLLGDFSSWHTGGPWALEAESGNYTSWRYSVAYWCGVRCSGRAAVEAHDEPATGTPQHGQSARHHTVRVRDTRCNRLPLVPWPQLCDATESEVRVSGTAAREHRSLVETRATGWCSAWRVLIGACAADMRAHLETRLARLRATPHSSHI